MIEARRIGDGPIIQATMCESLGDNINGPSVVIRPDWTPGPGRLMMYFAHHKGQHIRLAFADRPEGPWQIHSPGVLPLGATPLAQARPDTSQPAWAEAAGMDGLYPHLASPDVWIDEPAGQFHMLFHGLAAHGEQVSYRASSPDGLDWRVEGQPIIETYMRRFSHTGQAFALARLGILLRERADGTWEHGPKLLEGEVRHVAVMAHGDRLDVLFTRIGDAPERIFHAAVPMDGPWERWHPGPETELLRPIAEWEGAGLPVRPSTAGAVDFANELRDPDVFTFEGATYMIYAGGGEAALGVAKLTGL